MDENVVGR
jgi:hypothetical protein